METGTDHPTTARVNEEGPLVAVIFQKNPDFKRKYLESEPKFLGITQIALSMFQFSLIWILPHLDYLSLYESIVQILCPLLVIIAGCVAIAAQNLHLPTLRACLGMQMVACCSCLFYTIVIVSKLDNFSDTPCWTYARHSSSIQKSICMKLQAASQHQFAEELLVEVAVLSISATLAAYCCKVINCCSPAARMPVINVGVPPSGSEERRSQTE